MGERPHRTQPRAHTATTAGHHTSWATALATQQVQQPAHRPLAMRPPPGPTLHLVTWSRACASFIVCGATELRRDTRGHRSDPERRERRSASFTGGRSASFTGATRETASIQTQPRVQHGHPGATGHSLLGLCAKPPGSRPLTHERACACACACVYKGAPHGSHRRHAYERGAA